RGAAQRAGGEHSPRARRSLRAVGGVLARACRPQPSLGAMTVKDPSGAMVVRYPLRGRLQVPLGTRRAASAAVSTTMACKPAPLLLHHVAALYTRVLGAGALP